MEWWSKLNRGGKIGVVVVGVGGLYLAFRWWRNRQAAAAGSTSSTSAAGGTTCPTGYTLDSTGQSCIPLSSATSDTVSYTAPGGGGYSGPASGLTGSVMQSLAPTSQPTDQTTQVTSPSGASYSGPLSGLAGIASQLFPSPAPAAAATNAGTPSGPQTVDIGGSTYDILGQITGAGGQYTGYNVGGGVPVSFGSVAGGIQQGLTPGQLAGLPVGTYAYTPAEYQNLVSTTQTTEKL